MAKYSVLFTRPLNTAQSVGAVHAEASSPKPRRLYDFWLGCPSVPVDAQIVWEIWRATAVGAASGTQPVPEPADPASAPSTALIFNALTSEPTYPTPAKIPFHEAMAQRASIRWTAYDSESKLVIPAVVGAGLVFRTPSILPVPGSLPQVDAFVSWEE